MKGDRDLMAEFMAEEQRSYIVGHPIGHSKSPAMYRAVYEACGLPWSYGSMDIPDEGEARSFMQQAGFLSINITTPYKPLALSVADESDNASRLAHGANLLVNDGAQGKPHLRAYNVDGIGCVAYLQREGVSFQGARAVICGNGPTALSIANAAISAGANVMLLGRDLERVRRIADDLATGLSVGTYQGSEDVIEGADIIIDATSLGMNDGDPAPFDTRLLRSGQVVLDTVYGHGTTSLIAGARKAGADAFDGSGMLVGQAVATIQIVAAAAEAVLSLDSSQLFEVMADAAGFSL